LLIIVTQLILLDKYPTVLIDEPWYANTLYNVAYHQEIKNTLFGGGGGDVVFFYTLLGAIWTKIVGFSFFKLRLLSVFLECVALFLFLKCLNKLTQQITKQSVYYTLLAGCIFIVNNNFFIIFRRIRPEGLSLICLLVALYSYMKWIDKPNENRVLLITGAMIMIGVMSHPNILVYGIVIGFFIIWDQIKQRHVSSIIYYSLGCLGTFLLFMGLYSLFSDQTYISLFFDKRVIQRADGGIANLLNNILRFPMFYSMGIKRLYSLIFEISVLVIPLFWFKKDKKLKRLSLIAITGLLLSLTMLNPFFRVHFCYTVLITCLLYLSILAMIPKKIMFNITLACGIVYFANNIVGDIYILYQNRNNESLSSLKEKIEATIKTDLKYRVVMGPPQFWFLSPDYYILTRKADENPDIKPDIIIKAPIFFSDQSPTTGQTNKGLYIPPMAEEPSRIVYEKATQLGYKKHEVETSGYGIIYMLEKTAKRK
tara:strand:- start:1743 stop:3188 length:1446 start_codon:yes stop_codon:yes gene_type:complete